MVGQWLKIVGKAIIEAAKFVDAPPTYVATASNQALAQQREEMQLAQLKLQYIQPQENIDFQQEQAKLSGERAKQMQAFIQQVEDARRQKNLDFQGWCLEVKKALQLELSDRTHQLHRELIARQRQISLKIVEERIKLENLPIWLVAAELLNDCSEDDLMPLRVFYLAPKPQKDFPDIELTLSEGLRQFFRNYSISGRDVDFLGAVALGDRFGSEASIKALFSALKSEPTLVLESETDGDYLNFRLACWGLNWSKYRYEPLISRLPYREILCESASSRARNWLKVRSLAIAAGVSQEEVDKTYGGDNLRNLEILQREERFRQAGIAIGDLELNYLFNKRDFEYLANVIIISHCLLAGLLADEYFFFQKKIPPLLPQLLSGLMQNVTDAEAVKDLVKAVVLYCQNFYQVGERHLASFVPEMALDLARSFAHLPDKSWAKGRMVYSVQSWLKLRGASPPQGFEPLLKAVESVVTKADIAYIQKLNDCLAAIGENRRLSLADACYNRGLQRFQENEYQAAIGDFDQAIQVNPKLADAFYKRGQAYIKLGLYQKGIKDYTEALRINPNWAFVYHNRGNVYYKLGQHEKAIADYERALSVNPNLAEAAKNREIVQNAWNELKRRQKEEEKQDAQQ